MTMKKIGQVDHAQERIARAKTEEIIGVPGLSIWGGRIDEFYLQALRGNRARYIFREMENDLVIGALLDALIMPLLSAEFSVPPLTEEKPDLDAAEFIESCMYDMNGYTWRQHALDMLSELTWGYSISEIVIKKRMGQEADPPSQFNDGKLGLQILDPRGQETKDSWGRDPESKEIISFIQQDPETSMLIEIPLWKCVHSTFRSRKRNPEGKSPMESLYRAWYFRKNLETIEAIGIERDLAGLPVIYLPLGASKEDAAKAFKIVKSMRNDEQAGIVVPAPLSPEDKHGWKIELLSSGPKSYDARETIRDWNKSIMMRFFAQFLWLGMERTGTQALVEGSQDFFSMGLKSIQQELLETWNLQLVPFLMKLNPFPGITGYPELKWSDPTKAALGNLSEVLDKLVRSKLITPGADLEDWLRSMVGMPDRPEGVGEGDRELPPTNQLFITEKRALPEGGQGDPFGSGKFDLRTGGDTATKAMNAYQKKLVGIFEDWAKATRKKLRKAGENRTRLLEVLDKQLIVLEEKYTKAGQKGLTDAFKLGYKDPLDELAKVELQEQLDFNQNIVSTKLVPWLRERMALGIAGLLGVQTYALTDAGLAVLFDGKLGTIMQLAGNFWSTMFKGAGHKQKKIDGILKASGKPPRKVKWVLDFGAEHCMASAGHHGCPDLAGSYDSWEDMPTVPGGMVTCRGNCRCTIEVEKEKGGWFDPISGVSAILEPIGLGVE